MFFLNGTYVLTAITFEKEIMCALVADFFEEQVLGHIPKSYLTHNCIAMETVWLSIQGKIQGIIQLNQHSFFTKIQKLP